MKKIMEEQNKITKKVQNSDVFPYNLPSKRDLDHEEYK